MEEDRSSKRPHEADSSFIERTPKRPSYGLDSIITVLVGPDENAFAVHKDVICARSEFFGAACSQRWNQDRQRAIPLSHIEPSKFRMYIDWTYTGALVNPNDTDEQKNSDAVSIYLLGDELLDVRLRNAALHYLDSQVTDAKTTGKQWFLRPREFRRIWENTPTTSPLRQWTVDVAVLALKRKYFVDMASRYPADFVLEIAKKSFPELPLGARGAEHSVTKYLEPESEEHAQQHREFGHQREAETLEDADESTLAAFR